MKKYMVVALLLALHQDTYSMESALAPSGDDFFVDFGWASESEETPEEQVISDTSVLPESLPAVVQVEPSAHDSAAYFKAVLAPFDFLNGVMQDLNSRQSTPQDKADALSDVFYYMNQNDKKLSAQYEKNFYDENLLTIWQHAVLAM